MLVRLVVGGALALGLVAADAAALAGSAEARVYKGKTAQGYGMKIVAKKGTFRIHVFDVELKCRDGSWLAPLLRRQELLLRTSGEESREHQPEQRSDHHEAGRLGCEDAVETPGQTAGEDHRAEPE